MLKPQPYKLKNSIQHYEWGTKGRNAFIPKLLNIKAEKDKPYAELWMGAHPKASSQIVVDGNELDLLNTIQKYPIEMLGRKTAKQFSNSLPFLFKVLSANEALSIQVHPSKNRAVQLHKNDPVNYPDPNYKLEIAIALDSLTALVGLKTLKEVIYVLTKYPEIADFIGNKKWFKTKKSLKAIFTKLIINSLTNGDSLSAAIQILQSRIQKLKRKTAIDKLFLQLHKKYQNDVGLFLIFFLNHVQLKKGEAIFTKPGVPHAYLKGNILECMSNSDNVIRAGLTPKFKDAASLLKTITFESPKPKILKGKKKKDFFVYKTAAKEFEIQIFTLTKKELKFENQIGPRILFVLEGNLKLLSSDNGKNIAIKYAKGDSVFLPSILSKFEIAPEKSVSFVLVTVP